MVVGGARHADVSLFTKDVELHGLKNRSYTGEECKEGEQGCAPSELPCDQEADED